MVPIDFHDGGVVVRVDPLNMFWAANDALAERGLRIAECVDRIVGVWNGLRLGWVGATAVEAQAFNEAWGLSIGGLFGTEASPDSGVLFLLGNGVVRAAVNYGEAEKAVVGMFSDFVGALAGGAVLGFVSDLVVAGGGSGLGGDGDGGYRDVTGGPVTQRTVSA